MLTCLIVIFRFQEYGELQRHICYIVRQKLLQGEGAFRLPFNQMPSIQRVSRRGTQLCRMPQKV